MNSACFKMLDSWESSRKISFMTILAVDPRDFHDRHGKADDGAEIVFFVLNSAAVIFLACHGPKAIRCGAGRVRPWEHLCHQSLACGFAQPTRNRSSGGRCIARRERTDVDLDRFVVDLPVQSFTANRVVPCSWGNGTRVCSSSVGQ
jgi:hypothetical protein